MRTITDPQMIVQAINAAMGGLNVADMPTPVEREVRGRERERRRVSAVRVGCGWVEWQASWVIGPRCRGVWEKGLGC